MIDLIMPVGASFGWGLCGRFLATELLSRTDLRVLSEGLEESFDQDDIETYHRIESVALDVRALRGEASPLSGHPAFQAMRGGTFEPWGVRTETPIRIGYCFFEENVLTPRALKHLRDDYDLIATGSSWCERVLREYGLDRVETVLQGVDAEHFHGGIGPKRRYRDRFVIFSGGKFEIRKAQDLVIRAASVLQQRHGDVWLAHAWHNPWSYSIRTMASSPWIKFDRNVQNSDRAIEKALKDNGVDLGRTIAIAPRPNRMMAPVYRDSDVGLFPNRCEGGTNLVLMEYLACGRAVIASNFSGHADVIGGDNALGLNAAREVEFKREERTTGVWDEPDLEEIIEALERLYQSPSTRDSLSRRAALSMKPLGWGQMADRVLEVFRTQGVVVGGHPLKMAQTRSPLGLESEPT